MDILNKQQHAQYFRISYLYYLRTNQYIPFLRVSLCANIERCLAQQFCQKLLRYTCLLGRSLYCTLSADIQLWQTTTFLIQHILKYPYLQQLMCSVYLKDHWWTQRRMLEVHKQTLKLLLGVNGKSDRMFSDRSHWNHSTIILSTFYVNSVHVPVWLSVYTQLVWNARVSLNPIFHNYVYLIHSLQGQF